MNKGKNHNPKVWTKQMLEWLHDHYSPPFPWESRYHRTTYRTCEAWRNEQ